MLTFAHYQVDSQSSLFSPNHQIPVRGADVCSLSGIQSKLSLFSPNHQIPVRGGDVCSLSGRQSNLSLSSHLIIKYQSGVLTFAHYQVDSRISLLSHLIIKYQSGVLTFAHYQVDSRIYVIVVVLMSLVRVLYIFSSHLHLNSLISLVVSHWTKPLYLNGRNQILLYFVCNFQQFPVTPINAKAIIRL